MFHCPDTATRKRDCDASTRSFYDQTRVHPRRTKSLRNKPKCSRDERPAMLDCAVYRWQSDARGRCFAMPNPTTRQYFSARVDPDASVDFDTRATECITVMAQRVGLAPEKIPNEVKNEQARVFPRIAFDAIEALGVSLKG